MRGKTNGRSQETTWRKKQYDLLMNLIRKEGEGWWISFLPPSHSTGSPGQQPNLQEPVKNKSVGYKTKCGTSCSRNTRHFKTGRTEVGSLLSVGPFGQ